MEMLALWLFDRERRLRTSIVRSGGMDHVTLDLPGLAQAMVRHQAAYLFMAHSHGSADPRPSRADIETTRHVWRLARTLGASLQDHWIVSRDGRFSFRDNRLL